MNDRGRANQIYRTRKDLLNAASRLLKTGQQPSIAQVADEAKVSRATAYRYFSNTEALISEVSLDDVMPNVDTFFSKNTSSDPTERLDLLEQTLHSIFYEHEKHLRISLANAIKQGIDHEADPTTPLRQNRRLPLIEAALTPIRDELDDETYTKLCATLSLVFGLEALIVFKDVLQIDQSEARAIKSWAIQMLVEKARDASNRDK